MKIVVNLSQKMVNIIMYNNVFKNVQIFIHLFSKTKINVWIIVEKKTQTINL